MRGVKVFTCRAESCGQRPYSGRPEWHLCWSQPVDRSRSGQLSKPHRRNHACTHQKAWGQGKGRSTRRVCRSMKNKKSSSIIKILLHRECVPTRPLRNYVTLDIYEN